MSVVDDSEPIGCQSTVLRRHVRLSVDDVGARNVEKGIAYEHLRI